MGNTSEIEKLQKKIKKLEKQLEELKNKLSSAQVYDSFHNNEADSDCDVYICDGVWMKSNGDTYDEDE
jgi:hypothetical protein